MIKSTTPPDTGFVITCEHGGNRIPSAYSGLFRAQQELLYTHLGFDPGALTMARALAKSLAAPLLASTTSRLLVDVNRSVGHPSLHADVIMAASAVLRQQIMDRHYLPYRTEAERLIRQVVASKGRVAHISCHSFTPELDGKVRNADIGLLYDPGRPGEADLCGRWKAALGTCAPELVVRRNYPYGGKGDGLTSWCRQHLPPDSYLGIELEVNQKHVARIASHWTALRKLIVESFHQALSSNDSMVPECAERSGDSMLCALPHRGREAFGG